MAWTAGAATFVGFVAADEQQQRLKNGTFGAVAGTSLGGVAAIASKDPDLLLWAAFGASLGAVAGWLVHLLLCVVASTPFGRRILEYVYGGLASVRSRLDRDDSDLLLRALGAWNVSFSRQIDLQAAAITQMTPSTAADSVIAMVVRSWLASVVDAFNVIFSRLAGRPEYRLRASLILFGRRDGQVLGQHWIFYAGESPLHRQRPFDQSSIAYRVVSTELPTPTFQKVAVANKEGQDRGGERYSSFYTFRVTDDAALTIDWPEEVNPEDPFVAAARDFVHTELSPAIQRVLKRWSRDVGLEVHLEPLEQSQPPPR